MSEFKDKVVLVTGGSRGIGKAVVKAFADLGAKVYFTFNNHEADADTVCRETGAVKFQCSQNNDTRINETVETIIKEAGRIDVLVNNAGITSDQFLMMMPADDWHKVLDTNLNGAFRWAKAVSRPMLIARSGCIVNIASVAGLVGIGGQTNYAASKGGLLAFSRALAAEMGPKGIRVNAVVPGFIQTDMTAKMPRQIKHQNLDRIVIKRFGKPEEVSGVVTFLASDCASYIVGQAIVVDGGLTATVS